MWNLLLVSNIFEEWEILAEFVFRVFRELLSCEICKQFKQKLFHMENKGRVIYCNLFDARAKIQDEK